MSDAEGKAPGKEARRKKTHPDTRTRDRPNVWSRSVSGGREVHTGQWSLNRNTPPKRGREKNGRLRTEGEAKKGQNYQWRVGKTILTRA